jgi:hypothetical protein
MDRLDHKPTADAKCRSGWVQRELRVGVDARSRDGLIEMRKAIEAETGS